MKFHGLTLRDLEYVAAVAEHGQFGRAAEACAVSQPALSAQVRKVEDAVGVVVFERTARQIRVTPRGAIVLTQIRRVLEEAARLFELGAASPSLLLGPVRIGVIATLAAYLVPHFIPRLRELHPELEPRLVEGLTDDLLPRLRDGELDAVLLSTPIADHGLETAPLFTEPFLAALPASSAMARRKSVSIADIDDDDLILLEDGHCLRRQALDLCPSSSRIGARRVMATGLETLRQMIAAGIGHSVFPVLATIGPWHDMGAMKGLVRYVPIEDGPGREVALVWRHAMPGGDDFRTLARSMAGGLPPEVIRAPLSATETDGGR